MPLIEVSDLVKTFPDGVTAVDGIGFEVGEGEIFGFLGPNGAGKTTTIRILVTLLAPTSGTAYVDGLDVTGDATAVRSRIGYAAQFIAVDPDLTGRENLVLQGRLHGVPRREAARRADAAGFDSTDRTTTTPIPNTPKTSTTAKIPSNPENARATTAGFARRWRWRA